MTPQFCWEDCLTTQSALNDLTEAEAEATREVARAEQGLRLMASDAALTRDEREIILDTIEELRDAHSDIVMEQAAMRAKLEISLIQLTNEAIEEFERVYGQAQPEPPGS